MGGGGSVLCLLCMRLFICALWSPAGKGLTSWLSFVVSYCEFVTFPWVSWVRYSTWLYRFLFFAPLLRQASFPTGTAGPRVGIFLSQLNTIIIYSIYLTYPYQPAGKIKTNSRTSATRWSYVDL